MKNCIICDTIKNCIIVTFMDQINVKRYYVLSSVAKEAKTALKKVA